MTTTGNFHAYGENAATFLIFHALASFPDALNAVFLRNLKRVGTRQRNKWPVFQKPEVWLFPNFGKGHGFGEPDAIVLTEDDHAFWIEVETAMDCQSDRKSLHRSMVQLNRFHRFQQTLRTPAKNSPGGRRIIGETISDKLVRRKAELKLRGHGVLQRIGKRLRNAVIGCKDHYVLFTVDKPRGVGKSGAAYSQVLADSARSVELPVDRCWYAYWKGDLEAKSRAAGMALELDSHYVRIKRN